MARAKAQSLTYDRIIATVAAIVGLGLVAFVIVRNEAFADPNFAVMMRVILSLVAGVFGATLPGFLNITWSGSGFALRAGGALALFALTYIFTPTVIQPTPSPDPGTDKVACVEIINDDPQAFGTTTRCGLDAKGVQAATVANLEKAAVQLQLMQFSQQKGLFGYLRDYIDDPTDAHWSVVNEQARRVQGYLDAALAAVSQFESMTEVNYAADKADISSLLYGKVPLIDELLQPDKPPAAEAHDWLDQLTAINAQVQAELDKLKDKIKAQTTA